MTSLLVQMELDVAKRLRVVNAELEQQLAAVTTERDKLKAEREQMDVGGLLGMITKKFPHATMLLIREVSVEVKDGVARYISTGREIPIEHLAYQTMVSDGVYTSSEATCSGGCSVGVPSDSCISKGVYNKKKCAVIHLGVPSEIELEVYRLTKEMIRPPVPDGKVLVDAYYSSLAMLKFQDAVTDLIATKSDRGFAVSSDECRVLYEAMLKAAQQGE